MASIKNVLRNCKYCSHKKMYLRKCCYYCDNKNSEHYLEVFRDDTVMHYCKGGNAKNERNSKYR